MRSPLKWHGGKSYVVRKCCRCCGKRGIDLLPAHNVYVEPFFGGGSFLLNKPKSWVEFASDVDPALMNFWKRFQGLDQWTEALKGWDYSQESFDTASMLIEHEINTSEWHSLFYLIKNRMSRSGLSKDFAWSDRLRGGQPGDINAWETFQDEVPTIRDRIKDVMFSCHDAFNLLHDAHIIASYPPLDISLGVPKVLIYCDPPYMIEMRTVVDTYAREVTAKGAAKKKRLDADRAWHYRLITELSEINASVVLSGYHSALYDSLLSNDWVLHEFEMANHSGQGKEKQRRVECLWVKTA